MSDYPPAARSRQSSYAALAVQAGVQEGRAGEGSASENQSPFWLVAVMKGRCDSPANEANIWRGYATNTRGVVKFRRDRFIVEVNAPSLEDAITVARGVDSLLHT